MTLRLDASAQDFERAFTALLAMKRESAPDVDEAVRGIIADVVARGDEALIELSKKFDRIDLAKSGLRVAPSEIEAAQKACPGAALDALKLARERIEAYHRRQKPSDDRFTDGPHGPTHIPDERFMDGSDGPP